MDKQLGSCLASLRDAADSVRSSGGFVDLAPYVVDFSELCKDLYSDEDISYAIAIVFDEDTGIFSILESLLRVRDKSVVRARESCWSFLALFIKKIGPRALHYAALLKEKSLTFFRREDSKSVQAAALTPLIVLLELNMARLKPAMFAVDQELSTLLMLEFRKAKTNSTLKANIIQLLGDLIEYFRESFEEENVLAILKLCLDTLEEQLQKSPQLVLMAGAIKCLDSLLMWFNDSLPAGGSVENSRRVFTCIEQVLWPREELKRYEPLKASLRLLSRHAGLFRMRLIESGIRNMHWLQEHCTHSNAKIRDAALPAYDQFITHVSCL